MKGDRMTEGWCLNELIVKTFVPRWLQLLFNFNYTGNYSKCPKRFEQWSATSSLWPSWPSMVRALSSLPRQDFYLLCLPQPSLWLSGTWTVNTYVYAWLTNFSVPNSAALGGKQGAHWWPSIYTNGGHMGWPTLFFEGRHMARPTTQLH